MNTTRSTPVGTLKVGDIILDRDGLELRVTAGRRVSVRLVDLTVEYVEAEMMAYRPEPTTRRTSVSAMATVADHAADLAYRRSGGGLHHQNLVRD